MKSPTGPKQSPHGPKQSHTRRTRIALVSIYDIENNATRSLAALLRQKGYSPIEVYLKDWANNDFIPPTDKEWQLTLELLKSEDIGLLAVSLRASAYITVARELSLKVREELKIPILWGGLHVSLMPDQCMETADMICRGEGEEAILRLAAGLKKGELPQKVPNLWVRQGDRIIKNPPAPLIQDLDSLPFRDYRTQNRKFYVNFNRVLVGDPMIDDPLFQMMNSRGCPFSCSFCYNKSLKEQVYPGEKPYFRLRSVDNVLAEIKDARKYFRNMRRVRFDDEVFPFDKDWMTEFSERYPREIGLPFQCFVQPTLVNREYVQKLKTAGLETVFMGIQNSEMTNKRYYNRAGSDDQVRQAVEMFNEFKIEGCYHIIWDNPLSEREEKEHTVEFLLSLPRPFHLFLFSLTHFPNTGTTDLLLQKGTITTGEVEGLGGIKTFSQYRVDLAYPRSREDLFYLSIIILLTKRFLPKWLIRRLWRSRYFRRHPRILSFFAQVVNFVKMGFIAARMTIRGEMTWALVRRWLNMRSLITE